MLIETKVKISKRIDDKTFKSTVTYLTDSEHLVEAITNVISYLDILKRSHQIEDADLLSCKQSNIKEVATQFEGNKSYIATLKDIWIDEIGNEKSMRYKVFLGAADLTECNSRVQDLAKEGYDMKVESLTEVDMMYLDESDFTVSNESDNRD